MTQVLYVSYDGMTDPLGQSQVLPYLTGLAAAGYRITLISCEKPDRFAKHRPLIKSLTSAAGIDWHPLPYTKSPPVLSTLADVRRMRKAAVRLHKQKRFGLVHCRSYVGSLVGLYLKEKHKVPYLFDMRGFWPDEKVDAGAWNLKNPLYKAVYGYFKQKEKAFVQQADHIISLTHRGVEEMKSWKHVQPRPGSVTVIPCCVDTALFDRTAVTEAERQAMKTELKIREGDAVISYLGSIGTWYMLNEMLDFFSVFKTKVPDARLLFITQDEHERIRSVAAEKGLSPADVLIRGAARKEVPVLLSLCRYSVFFIRPTYSKAASSPTKQGELMAMGMPVICNTGVGDTDGIVNGCQSGVLVNGFAAGAYEAAVDALLTTSFQPQAIRQHAIEYFSLQKGVDKYKEVYRRIVK